MKICLKQKAGVMTKEEFLDNLGVYRGMRDVTGYLFAERDPDTGFVVVYYEALPDWIARFPKEVLLHSQSYVEIGQ